jgi:hypothetical protein
LLIEEFIDLDKNKTNNKKEEQLQEKNKYEFDYSRANWIKFKDILEKVQIGDILGRKNIEEINKFVVDNILTAATTCLPIKTKNKAKRIKTPKYLRKLIKHRRSLNKNKKLIGNNSDLNPINHFRW